jgi:hypothetical protein
MTLPVLPLRDMSDRHRGLTRALADSYLEAARVSLGRHHEPPQEFTLQNASHSSNAELLILLEWKPPDDRCRAAWANQDDATRDGAYACAIAAIELLLGLYAIRRAETLTGADYYVAPSGHTSEDLEDCYRLEVSGTNAGEYEVQRRLSMKVRQAQHGRSNLPAWVVVVGFRVKRIAMQAVEALL